MSAWRFCLPAVTLTLALSVPAFSAPRSSKAKKAQSQPSADVVKTDAADKTDSGRQAKEGSTSRPAEPDGSVSRALTRLHRIPRHPVPRGRVPGALPRQFGPRHKDDGSPAERNAIAGRGEAPRAAISERDRMGYQHADAIRNSISEQPIGDELRRPPDDGHIVPNGANGPAVRREDSLTAYNWGPYPDDYYSGTRQHGDDQFDEDDAGRYYEFGFTEGYQYGRWGRSHERIQSVLSHANTQLSRGLAAFRAGQYRTSARYFKLASDMNRGDPAAMIYAAHALFAVGRYREGSGYLREAFELEPRISLLTYDMRDDYRRKDDFREQLEELEHALKISPRNLDRLSMLGYVLNYSGEPDRAYEVLAKARAIAPRDNLIRLLYESTSPPDVER